MQTFEQTQSAAEQHQVLLFYRYIPIEDPLTVKAAVISLCEKYQLTGRIIVAEEGVNATLEGTTPNTEGFLQEFLADERWADVQIKKSASRGKSFPKLVVKVRREIVGTGFSREEADPTIRTAPHISPEELRRWYEKQDDFVVVDMRNSYEFASGHFKNAVDPGISASRHLPLAMRKIKHLKDTKVLAVCTGGVRCEKMSAYLLSKGFSNVYQLEGGIHSYMEKYPGKDFQGTLYTFDGRQTMHFGGEREIIGKCHLCGDATERYADCANDTCHTHFLACNSCRDSADRAYCSELCKSAL